MTAILPLLLGLGAWGCALAAVLRKKPGLLTPSWFLCGWALLFPLLQMGQWVSKGDVSAIYDVTGAFVFAAEVLLAGNTLLTALGLFLAKYPLSARKSDFH